MVDVCGKCKKWREDHYWNDEIHLNKHRFFKIMLGDFENELRIPRKFKDEFKGDLLEEVNLCGPSGNIWITKLVRKEGDLFFGHGWEMFAKDHGLSLADFLVFRYLGKSSFEVNIFDGTGCEKEGCYFVDRNGNSRTGSQHCCALREAPNAPSNTCKGLRSLSPFDDENESHDNSTTQRVNAQANGQYSGADSEPRNSLSKGNRIRCLVSSRRDISREEEMAVLEEAKKHSTAVTANTKKDHLKPPSCLIVMKPSHVSHGFTLTIPKWFVDLYLTEASHGVELRVPPGKKTWQVQFNRWKQQGTLNKGWAEFVLDNNLEVSDVCVVALPPANYPKKKKKNKLLSVRKEKTGALRLKEKKKTVLNVSIFRVVQDIVELEVF